MNHLQVDGLVPTISPRQSADEEFAPFYFYIFYSAVDLCKPHLYPRVSPFNLSGREVHFRVTSFVFCFVWLIFNSQSRPLLLYRDSNRLPSVPCRPASSYQTFISTKRDQTSILCGLPQTSSLYGPCEHVMSCWNQCQNRPAVIGSGPVLARFRRVMTSYYVIVISQVIKSLLAYC